MEETSANQPIDLRDVLRPIKAHLWLIVICVSLATALTYYHYSTQPKQYRATASLYVGSTNPSQLVNSTATDRETTDLASLVDSSAVSELAAKELVAAGHLGALRGAVSASPVLGSDFVSVTATSDSAENAAALANATVNAFIQTQTNSIKQQASVIIAQAQRSLSVIPNTLANDFQRSELAATIQSMQSVVSDPTAGLRLSNPAYPPGEPFAPDPKKSAIFAFFITLLLTIAGAYALERLDRRIRKVADVEKVYGYPVLAAVPRARKPTPSSDGVAILSDEVREAFRTLRMNLELAALDRRPKVIAVASAVPREGKSTVVRNLALAYREAGLDVCVVDADLRRPDLAELLDVPSVPGLTDVVVGDETLSVAEKRVHAGVPGMRTLARLQAASEAQSAADPLNRIALSRNGAGEHEVGSLVVLPSGPEPANPPVVLGSDRMRSILASLAERFDVVLIDTSPILSVSDAVPLLSAADGVLVVTRLAMTTSDVAESLIEQLRRIPGANLLGVVTNDVHGRELTHNYYTYGYATARATA